MTTPADFFSMPEPDVQRGTGGSPLLVPAGFGEAARTKYTRASYMADFLEEKDHIHRWEMRYLAIAMGQNADLAQLAAAETYNTGIFKPSKGREKSASGRRVDDIIERALDRVGIHEKADRGTAVHGFTEPEWWTGGRTEQQIPEPLRGPVRSFWETNRREAIEIIGTEIFTANDNTLSAGTFDHAVKVHGHPVLGDDKVIIADKKTGRFSPFEWCIQISTYARGEVYDTDTDLRVPWPGEVNLDYGLVWQIDCEPGVPDDRRTKLWVIDLQLGWRLAQAAAFVRDSHERKDIAGAYVSPSFGQRLAHCNTSRGLWYLRESTTNPAERALAEEKARSL